MSSPISRECVGPGWLFPEASALRATSYADALTAAIRRHGHLEIDGLDFRLTGSEPTDYVETGRHILLYRLAGTDKLYRLMVEPVLETHR